MKANLQIESKRLPDGKGGLFLNGELVETFDTEEESDKAGIMMSRMVVVSGIGKICGQVLKDEKPFELFAEYANGGKQ